MSESPRTPDNPLPLASSSAGTPAVRGSSAAWPHWRGTLIGAGIATAVAVGLTAIVVTQTPGQAEASKKSTPTSHARSHSPDPLTSDAEDKTPLGGDPKVPDKTGESQAEASKALGSWSASNPAGSGSHAVGGGSASEGAGDVSEVMRIPALGSTWAQPVYEGTGDRQLRAGLGHFADTEQPGQDGNFAVAGHRSGVSSPAFKNVNNIRPGAQIIVTTKHRVTFTYKVTKVKTIAPTDVNVIAEVPGEPTAKATKPMLTLVTCWPATGHSKRVAIIAQQVGDGRGGTSAP